MVAANPVKSLYQHLPVKQCIALLFNLSIMEILPEAADSFLSPQLSGLDVCVEELLKN